MSTGATGRRLLPSLGGLALLVVAHGCGGAQQGDPCGVRLSRNRLALRHHSQAVNCVATRIVSVS